MKEASVFVMSFCGDPDATGLKQPEVELVSSWTLYGSVPAEVHTTAKFTDCPESSVYVEGEIVTLVPRKEGSTLTVTEAHALAIGVPLLLSVTSTL